MLLALPPSGAPPSERTYIMDAPLTNIVICYYHNVIVVFISMYNDLFVTSLIDSRTM